MSEENRKISIPPVRTSSTLLVREETP